MNQETNKTFEIIHSWYEKWKIEINYFDKFIYFFISFNAFYSQLVLDENWRKSEYKRFLWKKKDWDTNRLLFFVNKYEDLFKKNIKPSLKLNKYFSFINKREHPDHPNKKKWWVVRLDNPSEVIRYREIDNLKEFILTVYQVRSNLFHWWKNTNNDNSKNLIEETNLVFEEFLKFIYKKQ